MRKERSGYISGYSIESVPVQSASHAGDQVTKPLKHDLEDHIEALRGMDEQRKDSGGLRTYGIKVLEEWIKTEPRMINTSWDSRGTEAKERGDAEDTVSRYARVIGTLYRYRRTDRDDKIPSDGLKQFFDQLIKKMGGLKLAPEPPVFLKQLKSHYLSVLFAAELMQALVATPGRPYSKAALLCYYWIIREIYTADAPGWNIGGTRAAIGGMESAYVTAQCLIAVIRFIQSQKDTMQFIGNLRSYLMQMQRLDTDSGISTIWKQQEKKRLKYSCYVGLQQYSKALALPFGEPAAAKSMDAFMRDLDNNAVKKLRGAIAKVAEAFKQAIDEVDCFRDCEQKECHGTPKEVEHKRQTLGHERARLSLERGKNIAASALALFDKDPALEVPVLLEKIQGKMQEAVVGTRNILRPVETYLSYVLDHELAAAALGQNSTWDPNEMAFAAASLGILDKRWQEDERLLMSVFHLSKVISDRGRFPAGPPFHQEGMDSMHYVYPGYVIAAFAELLRCCTNTVEMDLGLGKKMLRFFDDTRVQQAVVDKDITKPENEPEDRGWFYEYDVLNRRCFRPSATLAAVCGLAALNRMLDERINHTILEHFQVRRPQRDIKLELDALFYPDYGLYKFPESLEIAAKDPETGESVFDQSE